MTLQYNAIRLLIEWKQSEKAAFKTLELVNYYRDIENHWNAARQPVDVADVSDDADVADSRRFQGPPGPPGPPIPLMRRTQRRSRRCPHRWAASARESAPGRRRRWRSRRRSGSRVLCESHTITFATGIRLFFWPFSNETHSLCIIVIVI